MTRREVTVTDDFFDDLNMLLPAERGSTGGLSRTDFLAYEMPAIIDLLAADFEGSTTAQPNMLARSLITISPLLGAVSVYAELTIDGVVSVVGLEIDQWQPGEW